MRIKLRNELALIFAALALVSCASQNVQAPDQIKREPIVVPGEDSRSPQSEQHKPSEHVGPSPYRVGCMDELPELLASDLSVGEVLSRPSIHFKSVSHMMAWSSKPAKYVVLGCIDDFTSLFGKPPEEIRPPVDFEQEQMIHLFEFGSLNDMLEVRAIEDTADGLIVRSIHWYARVSPGMVATVTEEVAIPRQSKLIKIARPILAPIETRPKP